MPALHMKLEPSVSSGVSVYIGVGVECPTASARVFACNFLQV